MAKAKKQTATTDATTVNPTTPAKKAPKAAAKKAGKPAQTQPAMVPMIDTGLAAATAAKRIAHRDELAAANNPSHGESAAFKQMKENLHKPIGQNTPSFLQEPVLGKKFNNAVPGRHQQLGRNQTFGADVNRTGVPRRTGG